MSRRFASPAVVAFDRRHWQQLVDGVASLARAAAAEQPFDLVGLSTVRNSLKRIGSAELPIEGASAADVRAAFLGAARALVMVTGERRVAIGRLAGAAAACVDQLLDAERRASAAGWQRQFRD